MFKKYLMEDVFHKVELTRIKKTFDKANDVSKKQTSEFNLPLINAKNGDNGIMYYGRMDDWESDIYCIDIVNDGAISTGNVYVQPQRTGVLYNAYMIKPNKTIESEEILLFLAKTIEKAIKHRFGYDNKATWDKVQTISIFLPVIENPNPNHEYTVDDIDWQYTRDYIKELKHDYIKELDAYLQATGLNDYELTEKDKKVLGGEDEVRFGYFKIENVFHKIELKRIKKIFDKNSDVSIECTKEYSLPLINAKNGDNGIMYYGKPYDWESDTYCIDIVNDGAISTGNVCPQPQRTGILYNAYMIKPNANIESAEVLMYLSKSIEKVIKGQYGYDNKATWDKVKHNIIYLPITQTDEPDFDYMERYIRAIEKVVISDVVKYKDKVIEATKKVVNE